MTEEGAAVLRALAEALDVDSVLEKFPDLGRAGLQGILEEAARAAGPGRKGGKIIAFVDGAARGNPGEAGAGVVFKDAEGNVVERHALYLGTATNNMAEYKALILALRRAGELGVPALQVYSDSELLVNQINGRYRVRVPHLQELCQEAIRLMRAIGKVHISHIPREKNAEADEQANIAIDQSAKS